MVYEDYYRKYRKKVKIKKKINELENRKITLMGMVDVQATSPNKGSSSYTNKKSDKMSTYVGELEQIELELINKKKALEEVIEQLKEKEEDLRESKETLNKVYLYKYIEKLKYYQIAIKIGYEKTQTYEFINKVSENLSKIKSTEKNGKS